MSQLMLSVIEGVTISLLHIITVALALRYFIKTPPILIHIVSFVLYLISLCLLNMLITHAFWIAFTILAFCASSYLFLFSAVYKSLTLRILCEAQSFNGNPSLLELDSLVTIHTFAARIELLNKMNNIVISENQYELTPRGKKLASLLGKIRRFFYIRTRAIYHHNASNRPT